MQNGKVLHAHLCMFFAAAIWGLMSPIGKSAMQAGITGIDMVLFRTVGAAICFWIVSLCSKGKCKEQKIPRRDLMKLFGAGFFSIVCNQTFFNVGLSITSPINASIVTTSLPIMALISSAIFLHERVTFKKILGIFLGFSGALMLVFGSATSASARSGNVVGDLLCVAAQCSFAVYLALFKDVISRYDTVTCMKWMFSFAAIVTLPMTLPQFVKIPFENLTAMNWVETAFVVFGGTFVAYLLMMHAQKTLRPTVIAMYNYVQPTTSTILSVILGIGIFGLTQAAAILLIIAGVWTVNKAASKK